MNVAIDPMPFYEQRVVVLIETKPQANKYNQVLLDQEQVQKLSLIIGKNVVAVQGTSLIHSQIDRDTNTEYTLGSEIKTISK